MARKSWELQHPVLRIIQHLAFWALSFFVFLYIFITGPQPEKVDYVYTLLFQLSLLPAVYINNQLLISGLAKRKHVFSFLALLALLIMVFAWLNYNFFDNWSAKLFPGYFFISYFTFLEVVLFFVIYIVLTTLLKLSKAWFFVSQLQKQLLEKEKQKTEAELRALKAQINPHFFFNTLNNIYSMSLDKDERLPGTILQLSEMMRYFLYESKDNFVPLKKELAVAENYVALQKIRSGEKLQIEVAKEGDLEGKKIAPLLLITFLENAFKHGAKGGSANTFIKFTTIAEPGKIAFCIENNKGQVDEVETNEHSGLGLNNVKRQLELLYPGKHFLQVKNGSDRFMVNLQLMI